MASFFFFSEGCFIDEAVCLQLNLFFYQVKDLSFFPPMGNGFRKCGQESVCASQTRAQRGDHLRCGVQADAVGLRGRCGLVIGGEDGQAGGSVDHVIDQMANGRRA